MPLTGRYFTFNSVVRVNQIEGARNLNLGQDEGHEHSPEHVESLRAAFGKGWPDGRMTWALSWLALHDDRPQYRQIRELLRQYHRKFGDEITFIPGAYFSNAYSSREQVNTDLHEGLALVCDLVGRHYRPQSVVAGFLSAENQRFLAEEEGIHVCQGNIWSQYAIDNQDGEGSISYPYYPSKQHFCKPAQSARGQGDFIDSVCLDGWTCDFLAARREGFTEGFNSRMGVGPIETLGNHGPQIGFRQILATTANHYDVAHQLNGFSWVNVCWEAILVPQLGHLDRFADWLQAIRRNWPDATCPTQGEFGLKWREANPDNRALDYRFRERGTGIGGSDADKEIRWFMNRDFRLALLRDLNTNQENVIDFTRYDLDAVEPSEMTRRWSLLGQINQKKTRPQDAPIPFARLADQDQRRILARYPKIVE